MLRVGENKTQPVTRVDAKACNEERKQLMCVCVSDGRGGRPQAGMSVVTGIVDVSLCSPDANTG